LHFIEANRWQVVCAYIHSVIVRFELFLPSSNDYSPKHMSRIE
jgi:hypothetical protein